MPRLNSLRCFSELHPGTAHFLLFTSPSKNTSDNQVNPTKFNISSTSQKYQRVNNDIGVSLHLTSHKPTLGDFMQGEIQPRRGEIEPNIGKLSKLIQNSSYLCFYSFSKFSDVWFKLTLQMIFCLLHNQKFQKFPSPNQEDSSMSHQ